MSKLFDSNILIYHLHGKLSEEGELVLARALEEDAYISVITRIEILGWPGQTGASLLQAQKLLDQFNEHPVTKEIVDRCIDLRQHHSMKIPDAIIAATALYLSVPLVTRNTEDFKGIEGLRLIDPFESSGAHESTERGRSEPSAES